MLQSEALLQRLFSTFAGGLPGIGLLLQRIATGGLLFYCALENLDKTAQLVPNAASMIGAAAGVLLLLGLWTPVAGTLVAVVEIWNVLTYGSNPLVSIALAILGASLAMIGPGAWSIDARLFGRKYIDAG